MGVVGASIVFNMTKYNPKVSPKQFPQHSDDHTALTKKRKNFEKKIFAPFFDFLAGQQSLR